MKSYSEEKRINAFRLKSFRISCHFYQADLRLLERIERNHPFVKHEQRYNSDSYYMQKYGSAADIVALNEWTFLYGLLLDDISFTERVMDDIEENHGSEAIALVREVLLDGKTQEEAAAGAGMTRRQLQHSFGKWLGNIEPVLISDQPFHSSFQDFVDDAGMYSFWLRDRMRYSQRKQELDLFLAGVRSVDTEVVIYGNERTEKPLVELLEQKNAVEEKIREYDRKIDRVNSTVLHIPSYTYRWIAYAYYVMDMTMMYLSLEGDLNAEYMSRSMRKYLNAIFAEADPHP